MRRYLFALLTALAILPVSAQARIFTQPELDALVAPIALYPDGLVSDILVASTKPDEVFAAARLPKDAAAEESWDPAVKSLLSFPDILQRMADSPQWTRDLGEAFVGQEPHVMDTVQALRRRAQAQGTLKSNEQISVQEENQAVVVQPRTEVVYAPYYDPMVVYGPWWWPGYRPVFWSPWVATPVFVGGGFFWSRPVWVSKRVVVVDKHTHVHKHVNPHRHYVNRPPSQHQSHGGGYVSREFHRVPESQRRPIVNSTPQVRGDGRPHGQGGGRPQTRSEARPPHAMPAAPRYSDSRPHQAPRPTAQAPHQAPRPPVQLPQAPRQVSNPPPRVSHGGGEMRGGGGEMRGQQSGGRHMGGGGNHGGGARAGGGGRGGRG